MTNPAPTTEEREQFEAAWHAEYVYHGEIFKRSGILPERYANTRVQDGWLMWQAARRTAPDVRAMALEEAARICDERGASPFPADTSGKLRGFIFSDKWDAARNSDRACAAAIRARAAKKDET